MNYTKIPILKTLWNSFPRHLKEKISFLVTYVCITLAETELWNTLNILEHNYEKEHTSFAAHLRSAWDFHASPSLVFSSAGWLKGTGSLTCFPKTDQKSLQCAWSQDLGVNTPDQTDDPNQSIQKMLENQLHWARGRPWGVFPRQINWFRQKHGASAGEPPPWPSLYPSQPGLIMSVNVSLFSDLGNRVAFHSAGYYQEHRIRPLVSCTGWGQENLGEAQGSLPAGSLAGSGAASPALVCLYQHPLHGAQPSSVEARPFQQLFHEKMRSECFCFLNVWLAVPTLPPWRFRSPTCSVCRFLPWTRKILMMS